MSKKQKENKNLPIAVVKTNKEERHKKAFPLVNEKNVLLHFGHADFPD